jgi:hypothetical protein
MRQVCAMSSGRIPAGTTQLCHRAFG